MDTSLTEPISVEFPCGPDLEYDPEYLLLFTRAAPRAEAQYGDFISSPETVNWGELERDARRLLTRSKDIRILVILLRCRIQKAGAQGMAEAFMSLNHLCFTYSDAIHPQLISSEGSSAEDAAVARGNALSALLDHEGVMADIRSITLSTSAAMRLQVRDVERALSVPRPADALAPESIRHQLADLEARGELPLNAFRQALEATEHLQRWASETLNELAPDFTRLKQLLCLLPGAVRTTTMEVPPPETQIIQLDPAIINRTESAPVQNAIPPVNILAEQFMKVNADPWLISDRNNALEHLRIIRRWFENCEPSSPTIPLLRQAERLVGKRFAEVINEIPVELLEKWDMQE
jgi:type VI secretion system protein ImpA